MSLDKRLENLDRVIELQENSLKIAKARCEQPAAPPGCPAFPGRGSQESEPKVNRSVRRSSWPRTESTSSSVASRSLLTASFSEFFDLNMHTLSVGVPSQLLRNRPDIRQAERDLQAAGLDVNVARVNFFPRWPSRPGGVGLDAFSFNRYLFEPEP